MVRKILILCLLATLLFLLFFKTSAQADSIALETPIIHKHSDPLFEEIGWCESRGKLDAKNPNSSASGEFQWTKSSWAYYGKQLLGNDFYSKDIFSTDNRELAWYVYSKYGTKDWLASKACWGKVVMITLQERVGEIVSR